MTDKLETVNAAIAVFAPGTTVRREKTGWLVEWTTCSGKQCSRRWATEKDNELWPVWHKRWPWGGTCTMALSQLMRWLQERPVFGLGTWEYWVGDSIKLGKPELLDILRNGGYPIEQICVKCDRSINCKKHGLDWWSLNGTSGPSCRNPHTGACKNA
jgi:hypothetical protein